MLIKIHIENQKDQVGPIYKAYKNNKVVNNYGYSLSYSSAGSLENILIYDMLLNYLSINDEHHLLL